MIQPHEPGAGEFQEALLGLVSLSGVVDALLARCPDVEKTAPRSPAASELAHALLGLCSLRRTFALTLGALLAGEERGEVDRAEANWDRGHLR